MRVVGSAVVCSDGAGKNGQTGTSGVLGETGQALREGCEQSLRMLNSGSETKTSDSYLREPLNAIEGNLFAERNAPAAVVLGRSRSLRAAQAKPLSRFFVEENSVNFRYRSLKNGAATSLESVMKMTDEQNRLIGGCDGNPPRTMSAELHRGYARMHRETPINKAWASRYLTGIDEKQYREEFALAHEKAAQILKLEARHG